MGDEAVYQEMEFHDKSYFIGADKQKLSTM